MKTQFALLVALCLLVFSVYAGFMLAAILSKSHNTLLNCVVVLVAALVAACFLSYRAGSLGAF